MLPSLAPFESALQGSKPGAPLLVDVNRSISFRRQTIRDRVGDKRAVSQTLNSRKTSRPQISFPIFEECGYRTGFRASSVCGNSLGIDANESTRRAHPNVRVSIPN